jgi:hypothetical protein
MFWHINCQLEVFRFTIFLPDHFTEARPSKRE